MAQKRISKNLAIIPARKGSKGIPNKNLAPLNGRPLILYSIEVAMSSKYIDRVVVSTDSDEIAALSVKAGAQVPCLRPQELAQDDSHLADVMEHMLSYLESDGKWKLQTITCLLPTNPLRTTDDVDGAIEKFHRVKADTLTSISIASSHPQACVLMTDDHGALDFYLPRHKIEGNGIRQMRQEVYVSNGAIGVAKREMHRIDAKLKLRYIPGARWYGYRISNASALDINTSWDLFLAEQIMKYREIHP